jgi:hypothetical protein
VKILIRLFTYKAYTIQAPQTTVLQTNKRRSGGAGLEAKGDFDGID